MRHSNNGLRERDRLNWDDVRIFAAVADSKSIHRAAQLLRVTPGMVSRRVDELEAALGTRLFTRTNAGVVLTRAGEDMFDRALSMRHFAEAIEDSVRERDRKEEGMVVLRAPDGLAGHWLAPRMAAFLDNNPKIQLTVDCHTMAGDIGAAPDLLITADKTDCSVGDLVLPLGTLHYVFAAAPSYLEAFGTPKSAASAAGDHRILRHTGQDKQRESWGAAVTAAEALTRPTIMTNSSTVMLAALLGGAGICPLPSVYCHLYPTLQLVSELTIPIKLWVVTHREVSNSARVQRVADWLRSIFDTKLNPWFRDEFIPPSHFASELAAISGRLAPRSQPRARASASKGKAKPKR